MTPVFMATGRPKIATFFHGVRLTVLILCIYPLSKRWGIEGTSVAVCVSAAVCAFGAFMKTVAIVKVRTGIMGKTVLYPVGNTFLMLAGMIFIKWSLKRSDIFSFLAMTLTGGAIYLIANYLCNRFTDFKIYDIFKEKVWANLRKGTAG